MQSLVKKTTEMLVYISGLRNGTVSKSALIKHNNTEFHLVVCL